MAGLDYLKCEECGERLLYDGDHLLRDSLEEEGKTIFCGRCVDKLRDKKHAKQQNRRRRK